MKLALHRSLTFWCGLLTITFLCWAWRDSFTHVTRIARLDHGMRSIAGGLTIDRLQVGAPPFHFDREDISVSRASGFTDPFPAPHFLTSPDARFRNTFADMRHGPTDLRQLSIFLLSVYSGDCWILLIPYWLILLVVALLWIGLLVWRARRRKSIPATADAP